MSAPAQEAAMMISSGLLHTQTSSSIKPIENTAQRVTTVETNAATIKFTGGGDVSESDSEDELHVSKLDQKSADKQEDGVNANKDLLNSLVKGELKDVVPEIDNQTFNDVVGSNDTVSIPSNGGQSSTKHIPGTLPTTTTITTGSENGTSSPIGTTGEGCSVPTNQGPSSASSANQVPDEGACSSEPSSPAHADPNYAEKLAKMKSQRFNPFNRDVEWEEEHFGGRVRKAERPRSFSTSSDTLTESSQYSFPGGGKEEDITFADLGLAEDHFAQPEVSISCPYFGIL